MNSNKGKSCLHDELIALVLEQRRALLRIIQRSLFNVSNTLGEAVE